MERILDKEQFVKRAFWLVKLRWLAALVFIGILFLSNRFIVSQRIPLYTISVILLFYNLLLYLTLTYITHRQTAASGKIFHRIIVLQITADMFILTGILYYSGSVENPFYLFYILYATRIDHIILLKFFYFFFAVSQFHEDIYRILPPFRSEFSYTSGSSR